MSETYQKFRNLPVISITLVFINAAIFAVCTFTGNLLYNVGSLDAVKILTGGEYGRIIWSMFLHSNLNHIFNNMLILFFLGAMIEKEIGHIKYILLYFLSGIGGNFLSLFFKVMRHDSSVSVGASGAVFGLVGVLLAMVLLWDRKLDNVTPARVILMIAYSLYSGFTGDNIDNAAHIGGLLTGFLAGVLVCLVHKAGKKKMPPYSAEWEG